MRRGAIVEAARRDSADLLHGSLVFLAIWTGILGLNWKYVYNWCAGPFRFDSSLSAAPGAREFVRAEGRLAPTGMVQQTTFRMLRGQMETNKVSAHYLAMLVDGRLLIVKAPPDFSGQVAEGRLVPLPAAIGASLPADMNPHPWMLDADMGYRWDFNLFVMVAGPLLPLTLLLVLYFAWRRSSLTRHPALAGLRRHGPPLHVVQRIENEIMAEGDRSRAGPLWLTPSWVVLLSPSLHVYSTTDLIGVGHETKATKSGAHEHSLRFWARGQVISDTVDLSESDAGTALEGVRVWHPRLVVSDAKAFEERWDRDRKSCEREADAIRAAASVGP